MSLHFLSADVPLAIDLTKRFVDYLLLVGVHELLGLAWGVHLRRATQCPNTLLNCTLSLAKSWLGSGSLSLLRSNICLAQTTAHQHLCGGEIRACCAHLAHRLAHVILSQSQVGLRVAACGLLGSGQTRCALTNQWIPLGGQLRCTAHLLDRKGCLV